MKASRGDVEGYLSALAPDRADTLEEIRAIVHELAPDVTERMYYGMPAFVLGKTFLVMASQRDHISIYFVYDQSVLERHAALVKPYDPGKGTVRFRDLATIPWDLVRLLVSEAIAAVTGQTGGGPNR